MQSSAIRLPETGGERFAGSRVKGTMVRAHIDWVRDHRDRNEIIEFFELIAPRVKTVLSATWYPFEDVVELDRTIMNLFGNGDLRFLQELGAYSARQSLCGVHRAFRRDGVHEFFRHSALLHHRFQDFGSAQYAETGATEGRMVHSGYDSYSPIYCASAIGFHHECIRLHGGTHVTVWESECQCRGDATCTFEMVWS